MPAASVPALAIERLRRCIASCSARLEHAVAVCDLAGTHGPRAIALAEASSRRRVEFSNWTDDRLLRHPSFQGVREDKPASKVVRETPNSLYPANEDNHRANGWPYRGDAAQTPPRPPAIAAEKASRRGIEAKPPPGGCLAGDSSATGPAVPSHASRQDSVSRSRAHKARFRRYYKKVADWMLPHLSRDGRWRSFAARQADANRASFKSILAQGPRAIIAVERR